MLLEYLFIIIFLFVSCFISLLVFFLSYIFGIQKYDLEKLSAYECGFQPFEDARNKFDIKFYLVAILFIVFDLEVSFLFPWSILLNSFHFFRYYWMMLYLFILIVGFIYEWSKGALDWN